MKSLYSVAVVARKVVDNKEELFLLSRTIRATTPEKAEKEALESAKNSPFPKEDGYYKHAAVAAEISLNTLTNFLFTAMFTKKR